MLAGTFSTGGMFFIFLSAAVLSLVVSLALLRIYRRAVIKSMAARSGSAAIDADSREPSPQPARTPLQFNVLDANAGSAASESDNVRGSNRAFWNCICVYAAAGLVHAAVATVLLFTYSGTEFFLVRTLVVWAVYAWPVVLTFNLIWGPDRRARILSVAGYFIVLALLRSLRGANGQAYWELLVLWGSTMLLPTVLLYAFLGRKIRAVGPLVLAFMVLGMLGAQIAFGLMGTDRGLHSVVDIASALRLGSITMAALLTLCGFGLFAAAGWLAVGWLRRRYEAKQVSDLSVMIDSVWLCFTLFESFSLVIEKGAWGAAALAAFAAYKLVTIIGFSLLYGRALTRRNSRLLLLRVFGSQKRSEQLFDLIGARWRHAGSIQLIAGADLATASVEPHEFLDFLRGRLARHFISTREQLDRSIAGMDLLPDCDGRFRVNEFFCFEDTWRMALKRLAAMSDAVLMDLRGFTPEHKGCIFELRALIEAVPSSQVLMIVDDTTDSLFLKQTLSGVWERMRSVSPNAAVNSASLQMLKLKRAGSLEVRWIMRVLGSAGGAALQSAMASRV